MQAIEINVIYEKLAQILAQLEDLSKSQANSRDTYKSCNLNELFAALAKAQAEMQFAAMKNENPYFKTSYADLADVIKSSRAALTKHGLSVIQQIRTGDDGSSILHTILAHTSGQWIESTLRITPPKADIQSLGSYLTTIARLAYSRLVCIAEHDDDGEIAMYEARQIVAKGPSIKYNPKEQSYDVVTKEQLDELEYELAAVPDLAEEIMDKLRIQSLADLPKSKYQVTINRIREIKIARGIK